MRHFIFSDKYILVETDSHNLPSEEIWNRLISTGAISDIFTENLYDYTAAEYKSEREEITQGCSFIVLRQYFAEHTEEEENTAARAKGMLGWRTTHKFCPSCGGVLADDGKLAARNCALCGRQYFPRIEPCVIVLIKKGNEILLARHKTRNQNIFTCIAGFIETGESAEHAAVREVREETGLEIENLKYTGSQGWPFPDQLMLGYYADYKSGEIHVQEDELYEAAWFTKENLPPFPAPGSMGYRLISGAFKN